MKFAVIDYEVIPKRERKNLRGYIEEFLKLNVKCVEVTFNELEYGSVTACSSSLYKSAKTGCYPVTVIQRKGHVYLINNSI